MSVVSSVLIPIVKLWLRSQVEHIDLIEIEIAGRSRQILSGDIPKATVIGAGAKYQGLAISHIELSAANIHLNIAQMLKGEPLRLLNAIDVTMKASLTADDLQSCLRSPLLLEAIASDTAPIAQSDQDIRQLLEELLAKLGDQFTLHELEISNGAAQCSGAFAIAAT